MLKENEDMFEDWNLSEFKKILSLLKDWTSEKKYNTPGAHLEVKDKEGGNKTDSDFTEKSKSQKTILIIYSWQVQTEVDREWRQRGREGSIPSQPRKPSKPPIQGNPSIQQPDHFPFETTLIPIPAPTHFTKVKVAMKNKKITFLSFSAFFFRFGSTCLIRFCQTSYNLFKMYCFPKKLFQLFQIVLNM